jgi:hypothetical protein
MLPLTLNIIDQIDLVSELDLAVHLRSDAFSRKAIGINYEDNGRLESQTFSQPAANYRTAAINCYYLVCVVSPRIIRQAPHGS